MDTEYGIVGSSSSLEGVLSRSDESTSLKKRDPNSMITPPKSIEKARRIRRTVSSVSGSDVADSNLLYSASTKVVDTELLCAAPSLVADTTAGTPAGGLNDVRLDRPHSRFLAAPHRDVGTRNTNVWPAAD